MAYTHEQIEQAIAEWRQRLGLAHWQIRVRWQDEIDDGILAQVTSNTQRYAALLQLTEEICSRPAAAISECAAHEMLHLCTYGLYQTARMLLSNAGVELQTVGGDVLHREWELATDALAAALAQTMPLPESLRDDAAEEPLG